MFPYEGTEIAGIGEHEPDGAIELTVERVACPRHAEPFRARWPEGFTTFGLKLTEEIVNNETFMSSISGKMAKLHSFLDERPLCERVSRATLHRIYIESGIGVERRCQFCREVALGTPYTTRIDSNSRTKRFKHVCFRCVIYTLRSMN